MFVIKKIVSAFLLPPGIFILLLTAAGIISLIRKKSLGGILCLALAVLMWATATAPVADRLMLPLEAPYAQFNTPSGDVIVLLGGGIVEGVPDYSGKGAPSGDMLSRIVTAVRLQQRLQIPIIVSGGKVYQNISSEAGIAKRILTDLGVDQEKIILEERSQDTFDNARYTREICQARGFKQPIVLTSAYHLRRAVKLFEKAGLDVTAFPANFQSAADRQYGWQDLLPSSGSQGTTRAALHEYLGQIYYSLIPTEE